MSRYEELLLEEVELLWAQDDKNRKHGGPGLFDGVIETSQGLTSRGERCRRAKSLRAARETNNHIVSRIEEAVDAVPMQRWAAAMDRYETEFAREEAPDINFGFVLPGEQLFMKICDVIIEISQGQTPEQKKQLWDWFIEDTQELRDAWKKLVGKQ